jgi:hypothetical protein
MNQIRKNLSNILGWKTNRKIVVIESDDWGSIRTRSKHDYDVMLKAGLNVDANQFTRYDSLESNEDLDNLFDLLSSFKDSTSRSPVFTPICIVANPDFKKIKENSFQQYYFQSLDKTILDYPKHDKLIQLWRKGIESRLFVPALHAREHLNVKRFIKGLNDNNNNGLKIAFEHQSFGVTKYQEKEIIEHLGAFHPDDEKDIEDFESVINDAVELFEQTCGCKPLHFIPPNKESARQVDKYLADQGVKYITMSKLRKYPLGNERYKYQLNWWGKMNENKQTFLLRNAFFEPASNEHSDWVNQCLSEIELAFKWNKPALISTHRANYVGFIEEKNRSHGLSELKRLLEGMLNKWPDIEFMTSTELGDEINRDNKNC